MRLTNSSQCAAVKIGTERKHGLRIQGLGFRGLGVHGLRIEGLKFGMQEVGLEACFSFWISKSGV